MANTDIYPFGTGTLPAGVGIIDDMTTGGSDKALSAEQGKVIGGILYGNKKYYSVDLPVIYDNQQLKADSTAVGKTLEQVSKRTDSGCKNYRIPVKGVEQITYKKYTSNNGYGCLFLDKDDVVISGVVGSSGEPYAVTEAIPEGAVWFIWSYYPNSYVDASSRFCQVDYIVTKELDARLDKAEADIEELNRTGARGSSALATGMVPDLKGGKINESGEAVTNSAYMTTETIFGEFALELAEGFRIYEGHLYDRGGDLVSYQHIHPDVSHSGARGTWSNRLFMSNGNTVPEYGVRLTICKSDQSAIAEGEQPVRNFVILSDSGLRRWIPSDLPNYERALRRIDYIERLRWIPLAKVPNGYSESNQPENEANKRFCIAGRVAVGVPYSDVAETRTYVPNNVSLRTFMTAVKNRRSLLYTEELGTNTSKYGKTYTTGHRRAYYGEVCCGLTAWVMGLDLMYLAGTPYADNGIPGMSTVSYSSVNDLRPLDLISQEGHISIISDIWKDEFGNVKLIGWAEMSTPYPYRTLYTPEQFNTRKTNTSATVHRWNGWENLTEPETSEYSQYLLGQTRKEPEWSGDIMCFAGDYAAFAEGDIIYLNARRNSVYTGVELYKDDVLLDTIDITGLDADTIVTPNTEDWVAVNLTTLNLTYGKYKARLTDGTNTTDYTYFEVIDITMSAVKSGDNVVVSFASNEGTPVTIEKVKANGFPTGMNYHAITAGEVTTGSATLAWTYNSTYKYLLMLVKGDYGIVPKMISFPSS